MSFCHAIRLAVYSRDIPEKRALHGRLRHLLTESLDPLSKII